MRVCGQFTEVAVRVVVRGFARDVAVLDADQSHIEHPLTEGDCGAQVQVILRDLQDSVRELGRDERVLEGARPALVRAQLDRLLQLVEHLESVRLLAVRVALERGGGAEAARGGLDLQVRNLRLDHLPRVDLLEAAPAAHAHELFEDLLDKADELEGLVVVGEVVIEALLDALGLVVVGLLEVI